LRNFGKGLEADEVGLRCKLDAIEAAYTDYYNSLTDEQMMEEQEWAQNFGPNVFVGVET
jgi:hypothetical protein